MQFSQRCREFCRRQDDALEQRAVELPLELALAPFFPVAEPEVELAFLVALAAAHDDQIVGPGQFCHQR